MYKLNRTGLEPGWRNLSCLVTGFYPRSTKISMRWFKNDVLLVKGIWSTGVRPNGNHTYQIQTGLVTDSDDAVYCCEVDYPEIKTWIAEWIPEPRNRLVPVLPLLAILVVITVVYCVRKWVPAGRPDQRMTVMVQEDPSPNDILLKDTSDTGSDNRRDEAYGSGDSCDVSTEELALLSRPRAEQQTGPPDTSCPRAEQQTGPPDNSCPRAEQQTGPPDTSLSPDSSLQTPAQ
ncbi:uncharacterized protein LOC134036742 isoform X2 [Osmerus eperlanus]|uniref:uncharacterized protein LOC134036742 isoform X2 n=1 Tax=Osmerus eperlanus TaxID=29151 RepID=UPI002E0E83A7